MFNNSGYCKKKNKKCSNCWYFFGQFFQKFLVSYILAAGSISRTITRYIQVLIQTHSISNMCIIKLSATRIFFAFYFILISNLCLCPDGNGRTLEPHHFLGRHESTTFIGVFYHFEIYSCLQASVCVSSFARKSFSTFV